MLADGTASPHSGLLLKPAAPPGQADNAAWQRNNPGTWRTIKAVTSAAPEQPAGRGLASASSGSGDASHRLAGAPPRPTKGGGFGCGCCSSQGGSSTATAGNDSKQRVTKGFQKVTKLDGGSRLQVPT